MDQLRHRCVFSAKGHLQAFAYTITYGFSENYMPCFNFLSVKYHELMSGLFSFWRRRKRPARQRATDGSQTDLSPSRTWRLPRRQVLPGGHEQGQAKEVRGQSKSEFCLFRHNVCVSRVWILQRIGRCQHVTNIRQTQCFRL